MFVACTCTCTRVFVYLWSVVLCSEMYRVVVDGKFPLSSVLNAISNISCCISLSVCMHV